MKKFCLITVIVFIIFAMTEIKALSAVDKQINANIKSKRVPVGTVIKLKLLDPLNSSAMEEGDSFNLMVVENVKVDNSVVIPEGTVVRGSVEEVKKPSMLYRGGMVRLYFDHIVSSTGKQVRFSAGLCNSPSITYDGALSSKTTYSTALGQTTQNSKKIVTKPTNWAWEKGENVLNGKAKYVFAPAAAIVSAPVAGVYFVGDSIADIFKKGKDININQGETIQVQLLKPVDMPVY